MLYTAVLAVLLLLTAALLLILHAFFSAAEPLRTVVRALTVTSVLAAAGSDLIGRVLQRFGLALRAGPRAVLPFLSAVCLCVSLLAAVFCGVRKMTGRGRRDRILAGGVCAAASFACWVAIAAVLAAALFYGSAGDRAVVYKGRKLVEDSTSLTCRYYEYRGPLVRGSEVLFESDGVLRGAADG